MRQLHLVGGLIVAILSLSAAANAQDDVQLQMALDKTVELTADNMPILQVFQKLTDQTGVKFNLPDETLDLLPYGKDTRVSVRLGSVTLRKALSPLLAQQALQWAVDGNKVTVVPKEGLYRLGQRATFDEFRSLGLFYSKELQPVDKGGQVIDQLRALTKNTKLSFTFPADADKDAAFERANKVLPIIASEWLDRLCAGRAWTWFLRGDEIVVLELSAQVNRQLHKNVSVKYEGAKVMDVLLDLAKKSRVKLMMDPGVMDYLAPEVRDNFNMAVSSASVDQALQMVSGATGLRFVKTNEGVRVQASEALVRKAYAATQPGAQPRRRAPFFVKMNLPGPAGLNVEVFVSPDDLPPEIVDAIEAQKTQLIEKIRDSLPKKPPTTQPEATEANNRDPAEADEARP